jgi:hypothetical protein
MYRDSLFVLGTCSPQGQQETSVSRSRLEAHPQCRLVAKEYCYCREPQCGGYPRFPQLRPRHNVYCSGTHDRTNSLHDLQPMSQNRCSTTLGGSYHPLQVYVGLRAAVNMYIVELRTVPRHLARLQARRTISHRRPPCHRTAKCPSPA